MAIVGEIPLWLMFEKWIEAVAQAWWLFCWDLEVSLTITTLTLNALFWLIGHDSFTSSRCASIAFATFKVVWLETSRCLSFIFNIKSLVASYLLDMYDKPNYVTNAN